MTGVEAECLLMYLMSSDIVEPDQSAGLFAEAIACTERSADVFSASALQLAARLHGAADMFIGLAGSRGSGRKPATV